jgi:hypothetical protein
MKKVLLLFVVVFVFFACKKTSNPSGTQQINGVLHYDNLLGGIGMYYLVDSNKILIFKNKFASDSLEYVNYQFYVGVNTTLKYIDKGETGCFSGNPSICNLPQVEVVDFIIR